MPFTQDIIHRLEQGTGLRWVKITVSVLAVVAFFGAYNWRTFKNMSTQEAMDAAQLARNIAEGKGYTTQFVRPFSMFLIKRVNEKSGRAEVIEGVRDYARIRTPHPDIANPPVYPLILAGVLKVLPQSLFHASESPPFRYPVEFVISLFNEVLLLGLIVMLFFLTKRLFDPTVAWVSAIILFLTELFWRFAQSGLSTIVVMLIFASLLWCLLFVEREARAPEWRPRALFGLAALCGLLVAVGCLTRYAFGWLILPVVIYLAIFAGARRKVLALVAALTFLVVLTPWMARNFWISGAPFGTATFVAVEDTFVWTGDKLMRSLAPEFKVPTGISPMSPFWNKLMTQLKGVITSDAERFAGTWVSAFFLAGLVMNFRSPAIQRLRYFLLLCLPVLAVAQAMGRTQISKDSPDINTENLLVLLAPMVIVYGVGFFLVLLDQLELPLAFLRYVIITAFAALVCVPMLLVFLPPPPQTVAYPPYLPPRIQQVGGWLKENEMMMSDVPWAVAWYGNRQCVWLTRHLLPPPEERSSPDTFFAINDSQKPVAAIYLTQQTMDGRFLSDWVKAGERSWGNFIIDSMIRREVPPWFPLRAAPAPSGFLPDQLFLADYERWRRTPQAGPTIVVPETPAEP